MSNSTWKSVGYIAGRIAWRLKATREEIAGACGARTRPEGATDLGTRAALQKKGPSAEAPGELALAPAKPVGEETQQPVIWGKRARDANAGNVVEFWCAA